MPSTTPIIYLEKTYPRANFDQVFEVFQGFSFAFLSYQKDALGSSLPNNDPS